MGAALFRVPAIWPAVGILGVRLGTSRREAGIVRPSYGGGAAMESLVRLVSGGRWSWRPAAGYLEWCVGCVVAGKRRESESGRESQPGTIRHLHGACVADGDLRARTGSAVCHLPGLCAAHTYWTVSRRTQSSVGMVVSEAGVDLGGASSDGTRGRAWLCSPPATRRSARRARVPDRSPHEQPFAPPLRHPARRHGEPEAAYRH